MPGICSKVGETWNFNSNQNNIKLINLVFQDSLFKMMMIQGKNNHLHLCHIYIISINTVIQSQINLGFDCFYFKITWKIHGILGQQRSGNPVFV